MIYYFLSERDYGALAQLGERHAGSVEVSGSIPLCSTITFPIIPRLLPSGEGAFLICAPLFD
jgi:hypothetical protein